MKKPIEFRGYDPDTKRWYYGSYVALEEITFNPWGSTEEDRENNIKHYIFFTESTDWNLPTRKLRATVDPKSVGQYTGQQDADSKKIYEGDILSDGLFQVVVEWGASGWLCGDQDLWAFTEDGRYRVVGEIYEPPEVNNGQLVKGAK